MSRLHGESERSVGGPELTDLAARRTALTDHHHGLLVEAGAGSGKTAILAGRVALLLASGVAPRNVAAITFTEFAAAELAARVRQYVQKLADGEVPSPVAAAFPTGAPTLEQRAHLGRALADLDELTSSTIHGFARELMLPYPVEADLDPGASVLDADAASLLFDDVFTAWLRKRLGGVDNRADGGAAPAPNDDVVLTLLTHSDPVNMEALSELLELAHQHPEATVPSADLPAAFAAAASAAARFCSLVAALPTVPDNAEEMAAGIPALIDGLRTSPSEVGLAVTALSSFPPAVFTQKKTVRALRVKGKWVEGLRAEGYSKAAAEESHETALEAQREFATAYGALLETAVDHLLAGLLTALREVSVDYQHAKRQAAVLDFDDLITMAVELLRHHEPVRAELAARYQHVLIDEFQDTDPQQAEIVWRLTGEPAGDDWRAWPARPGARFVVGDPNQAIYRFRGADVATYLTLRDSLASDPNARSLQLTSNFRSVPGLLVNANETFATPLTGSGQAGYRPLHPQQPPHGRAAVRRLLITPAEREDDKAPSVAQLREAEAEAVTELCLRLVHGDDELLAGPVEPGDIALLAPSSAGLEYYERALENRGLSVASQAGKGFYRRQEVQDLVALTRALADPRDRLALGAVLRGPLVGASDEELLDVAEALNALPGEERYLSVTTDPELVPVPRVARVLTTLRPLVEQRFSLTPYALLTRAAEVLELKALLRHRHGDRSDRALANLERFLQRSRAYDLRGLTAFSRDVWAAWEERSNELEGRVDAERDAITLITMHSAKGLEWRVVIPVSSMSGPPKASGAFVSRDSDRVVAKLLGSPCSDHDPLLESEKEQLQAERLRLWYVTATRARDLLVVPSFDPIPSGDPWCALVEWQGAAAPDVPPRKPMSVREGRPGGDVAQNRELFTQQEAAIAAATPRLSRRAPSRQDDAVTSSMKAEEQKLLFTPELGATILAALDEVDEPRLSPSAQNVGSARGILLHKLMEEIINGEVNADATELVVRSDQLLAALGLPELDIDAAEVAAAAWRAWTLPEVAALHGRLLAEVEVAGNETDPDTPGGTIVWSGVADAVAVGEHGAAEVIIDWKSDRDPSPEAMAHYAAQVRAYLRLTGASSGLIVLATPGSAVPVEAT